MKQVLILLVVFLIPFSVDARERIENAGDLLKCRVEQVGRPYGPKEFQFNQISKLYFLQAGPYAVEVVPVIVNGRLAAGMHIFSDYFHIDVNYGWVDIDSADEESLIGNLVLGTAMEGYETVTVFCKLK